jgi:hypothetical protein
VPALCGECLFYQHSRDCPLRVGQIRTKPERSYSLFANLEETFEWMVDGFEATGEKSSVETVKIV